MSCSCCTTADYIAWVQHKHFQEYSLCLLLLSLQAAEASASQAAKEVASQREEAAALRAQLQQAATQSAVQAAENAALKQQVSGGWPATWVYRKRSAHCCLGKGPPPAMCLANM